MTAFADWNGLGSEEAFVKVLACCGSRAFATRLVASRPYAGIDAAIAAADDIWWSLTEADWLEAFACHPRIGEQTSGASRQFTTWSKQEQSDVCNGDASVLDQIAKKNRAYEQRHGFIYIVCASGRSAGELLTILEDRLNNPTTVEINNAAEQQRQITSLRLRKLFTP
ncbi:2-oxo-4-hydroxy-4-carboxy--5-ureidoimidazoline (OHCU) decarboxylase [Acidisarcina polymorpha]|uniref:2-oxo-4-hydroxy-4-carboxy-5-ureidoimidazoline decarboxylase n=1 Tax=Acidisarcina polymorpha TaxID=2211140 RepID=A0A2Z5FZD7_9BACT|nr:2-oxo-4-hydroxy-4-carboxy-5-ureidoimidazoline decarboxylase [Acidisarcina polymorpha]AXC11775.1 2-oxo-4-hydroxy-4-carboxy--5-ureidoimidazoline (OHCU) decarboxylase [Acidisarcina polymorpha]